MGDEEGGQEGGFFKGQGGGSGGGGGGKKFNQHTSLVPVTLKQIQMAPQDPVEERLMIDGREVTQVRVVGQIQEITMTNSGMTYTFHLDDGTAHTDVTVWLHDDPLGGVDFHHQTKDEWKDGIYVEVFGTIKIFSKENRRTIFANRINVVRDFNLLTHHFLQCIHAHLFALKGGNLGHHLQQVTGGMKKFDPYSFGGGAVKPDPVSNPYNSSLNAPTVAADASVNDQVVALCKTSPPQGLADLEIVRRLGHISADEVHTAIKFLVESGAIYTARENHYRA